MNPEELKRVPGSPAEWLSHAESDMRLAQLASQDARIRREQVCFHAQQAAEKSIKAVLLKQEVSFPLTHHIGTLLALAERNGIPLPEEVRRAGVLTPYAVETRYPGPWPEVTEAELEEALHVAQQVLAWAKGCISGSGEHES